MIDELPLREADFGRLDAADDADFGRWRAVGFSLSNIERMSSLSSSKSSSSTTGCRVVRRFVSENVLGSGMLGSVASGVVALWCWIFALLIGCLDFAPLLLGKLKWLLRFKF